VAGLTRYSTPAEAAARTISNAAVTPEGLGSLFNLLLNMPIFPEVIGGDGTFTVTSPSAGTVRVAAGTQWTHRGAFTYTSALTDLTTLANKTYHLRWSRTGGFALYDLSSGTYNPSALAETNSSFDTTYDDMLVARVVTSAGNVATITTLVNRARLAVYARAAGTPAATGAGTFAFTQSATTNWARTPTIRAITGGVQADASPAASLDHFANIVDQIAVTRYAASARVRSDWQSGASFASSGAYLDFNLSA
jgi:hypothetical protein